jgi:VWFA-related protein
VLDYCGSPDVAAPMVAEIGTRRYTKSNMSKSKTMLCTIALATSGLLAQAPAPSPLIRLYPVALNANGEPVTDLTANDFKIVDQTKPQTIFAFYKPLTQAPAPVGLLERSNRPGGRMPHSTVILFDMLDMNQPDRLDTWKDLDKSLSGLESGESLYFYLLTLEGVLVPIHAIGPASADDKTWPQGAAPVLDKAMKAASHGRAAQMGTEEEAKKLYKALEDLGNQLAALPGRRDIVWITGGVPSQWDPKNPKCKSLDFDAYRTFSNADKTQAAPNQASTSDPRSAGTGIAFDSQGNSWQTRNGAAIAGSGAGTGGDWVDCGLYVAHLAVTLEKDGIAVNPTSQSRDLSPEMNYNLEQMARLTGGHNYFKVDTPSVLRQVGQKFNSYEILYDPSAENWDNKFHQIQVTCARAGVRLEVRERYYALPDMRPAADRMKAVLMAAFQSPADAADIGLRTKIAPLEGDKPGVHMDIRINPSDILMREQGGKFTGAVYLLISDRSASGPLGEPNVANLPFELTAEQHDAVMKEGIPLPQDHPTAAAAQQVRIIVLDQNTNAVGSLTFAVK